MLRCLNFVQTLCNHFQSNFIHIRAGLSERLSSVASLPSPVSLDKYRRPVWFCRSSLRQLLFFILFGKIWICFWSAYRNRAFAGKNSKKVKNPLSDFIFLLNELLLPMLCFSYRFKAHWASKPWKLPKNGANRIIILHGQKKHHSVTINLCS